MAKMSTTSITTYRCLVPKERAEIDLSRWLLRSQLPHIGGLLGRSKNTLLIHTQVSEKNHPVQYGDQSLAPRAILSGLVPTVKDAMLNCESDFHQSEDKRTSKLNCHKLRSSYVTSILITKITSALCFCSN